MTDPLRVAAQRLFDAALDSGFPLEEIDHESSYAQHVTLRGRDLDALRAALAADAAGPSRAFSAMRTDVVALRDRALTREGEHAAIHGAASLNGWTHKVAAFDEVLSAIDETEEMS